MPLESTNYIGGLVSTNPTATDPKSQGDDHLRLLKNVLLNSFAGFPGLVLVTGTETQGATVNDYTVTITPAPAAYTSPMLAVFKATHANNGAVTVQFNALGPKSLLTVDGTPTVSGDIENGAIVGVFYDGSNFYLISGNDRAARSGEVYSGLHDFSGASAKFGDGVSFGSNTTGATPSLTDNSTKFATTAFVVQMAFQAALPAQAGSAGKVLITDGESARWDWNINHLYNLSAGIV